MSEESNLRVDLGAGGGRIGPVINGGFEQREGDPCKSV